MTAETPRTEPVTNTKHSDPRVAMMYWHERAMDAESHFERLTFERDALRARVAELEAALKPFANFACDEPCQCNNCVARALLSPSPEPTK